jgi:hypothetical protein
MPKFWVFGYPDYEASGGLGDLLEDDFDTFQQARQYTEGYAAENRFRSENIDIFRVEDNKATWIISRHGSRWSKNEGKTVDPDKFCHQCGEQLEMIGLSCQRCGHLEPRTEAG